MKLKIALLAAAGSFAVTTAQAENEYYGSVGLDHVFANDKLEFEVNEGTPNWGADYDVDNGYAISGALGRYYDQFRAELELAHRSPNFDDVPAVGNDFTGFGLVDGDIGLTTLLTNFIRDFSEPSVDTFRPYIGAGVGVALAKFDVYNSGFGGTPAPLDISDDDWGLAAQALAGITFDLTPNVDLDLRYKYLVTTDFEYAGTASGLDYVFETGYKGSEFGVVLRKTFGTPAAPAPAVLSYKDCWDGSRVAISADCPPEIVEEVILPTELSFTVYFDYDQATLSPAAQKLIDSKTAEAKQYDISSVTVSGNTDRAGSAAYNNALSARRASVVRDALQGNGINNNVITVQANGESNPARRTEDDVREPLNRRTEVTVGF